MATRHQIDMKVTQEAARWFLELQTEGPSCHEGFLEWLRRSPEHIEEFLAITSVSLKLDKIDPRHRIDIQALLEQARAEVVPLRDSPAHVRDAAGPDHGRRRWTRRLAVAAAAAVAVAAVLVPWLTLRPDIYTTRIGEQRTFRLDDGSIVTLNTQSRLAVNFSRSARELQLIEGEALFSVERDAARPFRVQSGSATVQAVGTQFNVLHSRQATTVLVVEGIVQVSTTPSEATSVSDTSKADTTPSPAAAAGTMQVFAGEQANVFEGHVQKKVQPDMQDMLAWRERKLIFNDKPLNEVVAEFNRYNSVKFEIGTDIANEPLSGVFAADRPESLVLFLRRDPAIRVERRGDLFIVSANHEER